MKKFLKFIDQLDDEAGGAVAAGFAVLICLVLIPFAPRLDLESKLFYGAITLIVALLLGYILRVEWLEWQKKTAKAKDPDA